MQAEEAKLITELAEMDAINYELFKQAYASSLDVNKFLDKYEMSKLLKEPYDMEGACIIIESRCGDTLSEVCSFSFLNPCCWRGEVRNCYGHEVTNSGFWFLSMDWLQNLVLALYLIFM